MTAPAAVASGLAPTGVLRAAINLGNPVMCQGSPQAPSGLTVDLAGELARRVGIPAELRCVGAARESFAALTGGAVDVAFIAIEPARSAEVAFVGPYAVIEAVFAVPAASSIASPSEVDRPGVRVGVKEGSAYDLFLTRTLEHAEIVRGREGVDVFLERGLEAGAGIRGPVQRFAAEHPGVRVLDAAFQKVGQAVATGRDRDPQTLAWLEETVSDLIRSGFVADAVDRSGQSGAVAIPRIP